MAGKELPFPLMERGQISSVAHLSAIIENYLNKSLNFDSDFDVICWGRWGYFKLQME